MHSSLSLESSEDYLLERVLELVIEQGPEAITFEALADNLGVPHTTIVDHFEDCDRLRANLAQLAREAIAAWMIDAIELAPVSSDPQETNRILFRAIGEAYLDFAIVEPRVFTLAFTCPQGSTDRPDDPDPWGIMMDAFEELVVDGQLSTERLIDGPIVAWAAIHGLATLFVQSGQTDTPEARNDMAIVLEGVGRALWLPLPSPERAIDLRQVARRDSAIRIDRDL